MKTLIAGLAAGLALSCAAPAAYAAKVITISPPAADGSISGTFGDTGLTLGGFDDVFTFSLPDGIAAATISTISTNLTNNVDFSSVDLNGHNFTIDSSGKVELQHLDDILVSSGTQTLTVQGASGGNGAFSGTIAFSGAPSIITGGGGVPEPAAWALMILGFGSAGAMLRSKKQLAQLV